MHRTTSGDRRHALQRTDRQLACDSRALQMAAARAPVARLEAQRLQGEADAALAESQALKIQARLENLTVWEMEKVKQSRKGSKIYTYWMASWRRAARRVMCTWEAAGRWILQKPARSPGKGRRRRWGWSPMKSS